MFYVIFSEIQVSLAAWQRQHSVNGNRLCLWEPRFLTPSQNRPPYLVAKKFGRGDYVATPIPNLVLICPWEASGQMGQRICEIIANI